MICDRPTSLSFEKPKFLHVLPVPEEIEVANVRLTKKIKQLGLFLLLLGLVFPTEWRGMVGPLDAQISWLTEAIPSIRKSVEVSAISELVRGFFGTVLLLLPLLFTFLIWGDPIAARFKYAYEKAESKFSFFATLYFVGTPFLIFMLYILFSPPIDVPFGVTRTGRELLFLLMTSFRVSMAVLGSFVVLWACILTWLLMVPLVGPFLCLLKWVVHHDK